MEFFDKLEETITTKSKEVADKAKKMAEIAGLRGQIGTCEEVLKKNYLEIGKLYFELYGDMPEEPFGKYCHSIKNAKNNVDELEQKIREIKGL